jgi:hypothetical protein
MTDIDVYNTIVENNLRLEKIIWIGGCINSSHFSDSDTFDDIRDIIEDGRKVDPSMKVFVDAPEWVWDGEDAFLEWVGEKMVSGFLVTAETPVPTWHAGDEIGTYSFSWGHTYSTILYVENPLDAVALAVAWREKLGTLHQAYPGESHSS